MKRFEGLDDFEGAVGSHMGFSNWHTVNQELVNQFADLTGDNQWIHVDSERAVSGPFGRTVVHGYLTLSLIPKMMWQIYKVDGLRMGINYGSDRVRFPAPLLVGSEVRAGAELLTLTRLSNGARSHVRVTVETAGGDKPVCVAEVVSLLVDK